MCLYSLGVILAVFICIYRILKDVKNNPAILENKDFKRKYDILTEDLNLNPKKNLGIIAPYWNTLILIRWAFTVCILVYLKDFNSF